MYNWIAKYGDPILRKVCDPVKIVDEEERKEFQQLWMEKVKDMLLGRKEIDRWLKLEERRLK